MHDLTAPRFVALTLALAGAWNAAVWGSRIWLMTEAEAAEWANVVRVGISVGFATVLLALAVRARTTQASGSPLVLTAFSVWMVVVWAPSVLSVAAGDGSYAFKVIHALLALISLAFGAALAGHARRETMFNRSARQSRLLRTTAPGTSSST